ncbi:MAG: B12-binding domain-containing radical SAM protein [Candidatus Helarchaeota archaeon]
MRGRVCSYWRGRTDPPGIDGEVAGRGGAKTNKRNRAYLEDGQFKRNPDRELIANLDDLPFPAWDLINPKKYPQIPHGRVMKRTPFAPIFTTRGCPYSCSYCSSCNFWRRKFRKRSAKNIVDEIEYLVKTFGIREIHIWDDNFTLVKSHVVEFCKEILRRKLDLTFCCPNGIRIDSLNEELLILMKRTGFFSLMFAIESGSQEILDRANKKLDLKIVPTIAKLAHDLGYYLPSYFIFGLPGETYKTARQSIEFAKSLPLNAMCSFSAKPLPGSQLFDTFFQHQDISKIDYDFFHFYGADTPIEVTDGTRKLVLPKDAFREFYFRPIQILRVIKDTIRLFHLSELIALIKNFFHFLVRKFE